VVTVPVWVQFTIRDPQAATQDASIEYSRDGGASWKAATAWPGLGVASRDFATNGAQASGVFVWDIERDVPERYAKGLLVQARLPGAPALAAAVSKAFDVDLQAADGHTPTSSLSVEDGAGPVVPLCLQLYDPDGELVSATIEFFSPMQGQWFTVTAADGSDLLAAAPAQPMGTEYQLLWDAQADAGRLFPPGTSQSGPVDLRVRVRKARRASLSDTQPTTVTIDASPYDSGLRDYPDMRPASLAVTGGVPQTGVGGQELATPLTLKLADPTGQPIPNGEIQVVVATGSALSAELPLSVFTDSNGQAQVTVRPEAGRDGQLDLDALVVGSPSCRLANKVSITVKAAKVILSATPPADWPAGGAQPFYFEYGSDDPNAGMNFAYGRPEVLQVDTMAVAGAGATDGRADTRVVRLGPGNYTQGYMPGFTVNCVAQAPGSIQVTVSEPGAATPLFSQSFPVVAPPKAQRRTGESTYADAQAQLVPLKGDDPTEHAEGTRWPKAGKEQWAWPGLTLQTPMRVQLLVDGKGDGITSGAVPSVTGGAGVVVDGPPPEPTFTSPCQSQGVTCTVLGTDALGGATGVDTLQVTWYAYGGTLSKTPATSPGDLSWLQASICEDVYFTPKNYDGPWSVQASVAAQVLDPGRQYWTRTTTDSSGVTHFEIHREDALFVNVAWTFEIQQAPVFLVDQDPQVPQATRISAGHEELVLVRVSPSAGTTNRTVAVNAMQATGSGISDYSGPRMPPPFNQNAVTLTLQPSGTELRSDTFLFVRGEPDTITPSMFSFLRASWVQVTALGPPIVIATDPPQRARLPLNGRPSVQEAIAGTTPFAGWEGTVALSDLEFVYPAGVLDVVTAYGPLSVYRTWRGHLGWEPRPWLNDDEQRVRDWAGAFGPGWIGSFEAELVPAPGGYRFMDANGRLTRIFGVEPANGLRAHVSTNSYIDDDHAPLHLELADHRIWRFHADGTLRDIVDPRGHRTAFWHDERSRLARIVDPHGHEVNFTPGTGTLERRVDTLTDDNQRAITFYYQTAATGGCEGMLGGSTGPAAQFQWGASATISFSETYGYEGATAAASGLLPYAQVRLRQVSRANESRVEVAHAPNGTVKTQTWNSGVMTFTPGPGTKRLVLVNNRDTTEQVVTFEGAAADAAAPTQVQEFIRATSFLRTTQFQHNREGRCVRAVRPDNLVERWTYDDANAYADCFQRGNLLAHEQAHTLQPAPAAPAPSVYRRVASWEYLDWQNRTRPTAAIPPESSARRTQRSWRTDRTYNQFGELTQVQEPSAYTTRIAEDGSLHGPSPLPYTMDHRVQRPTTVIGYNADGLVTTLQEPDGIVTEYAYFSQAALTSGAFTADGGGLLAQQRRDTTDTNDRQFWYLGQPVATRETLWSYDAYGHASAQTDSRGCQHTTASNALGMPLRIETGIAPAGMPGASRVERTEYDAHWRQSRHVIEQPGGTPEQGGTELVEQVTEFDAEDRPRTVSTTVSSTQVHIAKLSVDVEGRVDHVYRPADSTTATPQEIASIDQRDERGMPVQSTLHVGRGKQSIQVGQKWDDLSVPSSLSVGQDQVRSYRRGPFGNVAGSTAVQTNLATDCVPGTDGGEYRAQLTLGAQSGTRAPQQAGGLGDFAEERFNQWGLVRRTQSARDPRPAAAAPAAQAPDAAVEGAPGLPPDWVSGVTVRRDAGGLSPGSGRIADETGYDILGRQSTYENDRGNAWDVTWSPGGVQLRERVGEREQLAWDDPLVPWRTERWRWLPGVVWTRDLHRALDSRGDVASETVTLRTGTSSREWSLASNFTYDAFGRVATATDPMGNTTRFTYDVHGEIATMTDANGVMDATGTTNVDGNPTTWIRDGLGRVVKVRIDLVKGGVAGPGAVADGTVERSFTYTLEGRIATVSDALGFTTTWRYADNGQLASIEIPRPDAKAATDTTKQTLEYDDLGRPSQVTRASGVIHKMRYDAAHRLERLEASSASTAKAVVSFEYDRTGPARTKTLVWTWREPTASGPQDMRESRVIEQEFDGNGRATAETQHGALRNQATGAVVTSEHRLEYTYAGDGRRTSLKYSDGKLFTLDLDRTGRMLGVVDAKGGTVVRYEVVGDTFTRTRTCGQVKDLREVDTAGRLASIDVAVSGNSVIHHDLPDHDRCGRIQTWTRRALSAGVDETRKFTYDSAGRIVTEDASFPTVGKRSVTRKYDGDGVIVEEVRTDTPLSGTATTRTKTNKRGGGGAVYSTTTTDGAGKQKVTLVTYDAEGNVRYGGRQWLVHDGLGRLDEALSFVGTGTTRYSYDASHRLVQCTRLDSQHNAISREDYVWDEWRLIEVWRDGTLRERYVYGQGLNEVVRAEVDGVTLVPVYGPDGSVDALIDAAGNVVESYAYDLDGTVTVFDANRQPRATPPRFRFGFHGHFYDPVTRLHYMRERWYSSELAQFLEQDPEPPDKSTGGYTFCNGNVINNWDPYGRLAFLIPLLLIMLAGAAVGTVMALARQGAEWVDGRTQFDPYQVLWGAAIGAVAAPILVVLPELALPLMALGVGSGINELAQGHIATGVFDIATSLLPFASKGARAGMFGRGSAWNVWGAKAGWARSLGPIRPWGSRISPFYVKLGLIRFAPGDLIPESELPEGGIPERDIVVVRGEEVETVHNATGRPNHQPYYRSSGESSGASRAGCWQPVDQIGGPFGENWLNKLRYTEHGGVPEFLDVAKTEPNPLWRFGTAMNRCISEQLGSFMPAAEDVTPTFRLTTADQVNTELARMPGMFLKTSPVFVPYGAPWLATWIRRKYRR
jgi:RHS repeat-associated protein